MTTYKNVTNANLEFETSNGYDFKVTSGNNFYVGAF